MSEEGSPVRGVILAHASMAEGLVDAVRSISGCEPEALVPLSNRGKSPETLRDELEGLLGSGPGLVFTDLQTGSCALVARLAVRRLGNVSIVCGANLPMLLDFVFHRELPREELRDRLIGKGRDAIHELTQEPSRADSPLPD